MTRTTGSLPTAVRSLVVLALAVASLTSCAIFSGHESDNEWKQYRSADGYIVEYPEDWSVKRLSPSDAVWPQGLPGGTMTVFLSPAASASEIPSLLPFGKAGFGGSELRLGVLVLNEPIAGTLTESAHVLRTIQSDSQGYEEHRYAPTTIGNVDAVDWEYSYDAVTQGEPATPATTRILLAIVNGRMFTFIAGAFSDTFADQKQVVEHFFQSIAFTTGTSTTGSPTTGTSTTGSSPVNPRGYVYLSLMRLGELDRSFRDAHDSIQAVFDVVGAAPYSAKAIAAIDAAQKAWGELGTNVSVDPFVPEQEAQNEYIVPALEAIASAADSWLELLAALRFSSRTHVLPKRSVFESLTAIGKQQEADAFTALLKAEDETHRQYCEPYIGATPPEPGC